MTWIPKICVMHAEEYLEDVLQRQIWMPTQIKPIIKEECSPCTCTALTLE